MCYSIIPLSLHTHLSSHTTFPIEFEMPDGRKTAKLFFLTWNPQAAAAYSKVSYTHSKPIIREQISGVIDVEAQGVDQVKECMGMDDGESESDEDSDFEF